MKVSELGELYYSMKENNLKRCKFKFKYNNVEFDVIFFTDEKPFFLLFGVIGIGFSFEVKVKSYFDLEIMLERETYYKLRKILNIPKGENNPFKVSDFFKEFSTHIPKSANRVSVVKPRDIAVYRADLEEANKVYFYGWKDNTITNENVRPENLEKTRVLISAKMYEICKRKNISSKWTANKNKEREITVL